MCTIRLINDSYPFWGIQERPKGRPCSKEEVKEIDCVNGYIQVEVDDALIIVDLICLVEYDLTGATCNWPR